MTTSDLSVEAAHASTDAVRLVSAELTSIGDSLSEQGDHLDAIAELLTTCDRVFVFGLGRSGLAMRMAGMRLMHLGLIVHVVGDTTTPAIAKGDVLLVASGSGTTRGIVRAVEQARVAGAHVAALTTDGASPIARQADAVLVIAAAGKLDRSGSASAQYAGSLFEQAVVVVGDALFHTLWLRSGATADELWPRHANLE